MDIQVHIRYLLKWFQLLSNYMKVRKSPLSNNVLSRNRKPRYWLKAKDQHTNDNLYKQSITSLTYYHPHLISLTHRSLTYFQSKPPCHSFTFSMCSPSSDWYFVQKLEELIVPFSRHDTTPSLYFAEGCHLCLEAFVLLEMFQPSATL